MSTFKQLIIIFFISFFKLKPVLAPEYVNLWVVWNIGQGQWVTHIESDNCWHFDVGGEPGQSKNIQKTLFYFCGHKKNRIFLSHWDYDHFLNIPFLAKRLPEVCWQYQPTQFKDKPSAQKIIDLEIPSCNNLNQNIDLSYWLSPNVKKSNDSSAVFTKNNVLLSGDSPIKQEKIWSHELPNLNLMQVYILGHHGSATSTSAELLTALSGLKFVIASARYKKYRHPSVVTLNRLALARIPTLRTEAWGNIWFQTKSY